VLGNQILLAFVAILWPLSMRSLLRALHHDERLAIFACLLFWNRALAIGFLPFVASVPVAIFIIAGVVRQTDAFSIKRSVILAFASIGLFYIHVSGYLVAGVASAGIVLAARPRLRQVVTTSAAFIPSAIVAALWSMRASLTHTPREQVLSSYLTLRQSIRAMPLWAFDIWRSHSDEFGAITWWLAFALILGAGLQRVSSISIRLIPRTVWMRGSPVIAILIVYLIIPNSTGTAAGYLSLRLAPVIIMFSILWLPVARGRIGDIALVSATACTIIMGVSTSQQIRKAETWHVGEGFKNLLTRARPNTKMALVNFESRSPSPISLFWPYIYAGSYHRNRNSITAYSFAQLEHWSVHYAEAQRPPRHDDHWTFNACAFEYRQDGDYYDYVLVSGDASKFAPPPSAAQFAPVAQSGQFTLFEKTRDATLTGELDSTEPQNPCDHPRPATDDHTK
jgi:hypothetical protein